MPLRPLLNRQILPLPWRSFRHVVPRPAHARRRFTASAPARPTTNADSAPHPIDIKALRKKEHRFRNSLVKGVIAATITAYWLDGKYNARAVRRTLRTVWVGALLAADYKLNFTSQTVRFTG